MTRKRQTSNKANPSQLRQLVIITLAAVTLVNFAQSVHAQAQQWINPEGGLASNPDNWDTDSLPTGDLYFDYVNALKVSVIFDELTPTSNSHTYYNGTQWTIIPTSLHTITNDLTSYSTTTIQDGSIQVNGDTFIDGGELIIDGGTLNGPANPANLVVKQNSSGSIKVTNSGVAFVDLTTLLGSREIEVSTYGQLRVQKSIHCAENTYSSNINVNNNGILIVDKDISAVDTAPLFMINIDGGLLDVKGSINTGEEYRYTGVKVDDGTVNVGGNITTRGIFIINNGTINADFHLPGTNGLTMYRIPRGTYIHGGLINGTMNVSEQREGLITGGQTQTINLTGDNDWTIEGGFVENFTVANTSNLQVTGGDIANLAVVSTGSVSIAGGNVDLASVASSAEAVITGGSIEILATSGQSVASVDGGTFFGGIVAAEQSNVLIHDGDISEIVTLDAADVTMHGGQADTLSAMDDSLITLYLKTLDTFQSSGGLFSDGYLQGTWHDDTPFALNLRNDFGDTSDHLLIYLDQHLPDFNSDHSIDLLDLQILNDHYKSAATFAQGDYNGDGVVNLLDLDALGNFFELEYQPYPSAIVIPEPSSLACLLAAAACLTARRRKSATTTTICHLQQAGSARTITIALIAAVTTLAFTAATSARTLTWNAPGGGELNDYNWLPEGETIDDDYNEPSEIDDDLVFNLPGSYTITHETPNFFVHSMTFNQGDIVYTTPYYFRGIGVYDSVYLAPQPGDQVKLQMGSVEDGQYIWQIRNAMHIGGSNQGQGGKAIFNIPGGLELSVFGTVRVWPGSELNVHNAKVIADTVEILGRFNLESDDGIDEFENEFVYGCEMQTNLVIKQQGSANIRGGHFAYNGIAASGSGRLTYIDAFAQQLSMAMNSRARIGSGEIPQVIAGGNSTVDISGGSIETLAFYDDAVIRLFADDLTFSPAGTGEFGHGFVTGTWLNGDTFTMQLINLGSNEAHDHIVAAQFAPGDVNGDTIVDLVDLDILGANYGQEVSTRLLGDINSDGVVGLIDLDLLGQNFVSEVPPPAPEPATLTLLALAAACLTRRQH